MNHLLLSHVHTNTRDILYQNSSVVMFVRLMNIVLFWVRFLSFQTDQSLEYNYETKKFNYLKSEMNNVVF